MNPTPNWEPFLVFPGEKFPPSPRDIRSPEGVGDRLRAAAFAELQAYEAFLWAAARFEDAPEELRTAWRTLAAAEQRHLGWLMNRMKELGVDVQARGVSARLWESFMACKSAAEFARYMASAEDRGRLAGERFHREMLQTDPVSGEIFRKIAEEEIEHIQLAEKFFPTTVSK